MCNIGSIHYSPNQLFAPREWQTAARLLTVALVLLLEASMSGLSNINGCHGYQSYRTLKLSTCLIENLGLTRLACG